MVETLSSTFLNNFVLIFVAIDPFALIPIFAGITHGLQKKEIKSIYLRATFISFLILLFFSLVGGSLLDLMGVNINSFKIIDRANTKFTLKVKEALNIQWLNPVSYTHLTLPTILLV